MIRLIDPICPLNEPVHVPEQSADSSNLQSERVTDLMPSSEILISVAERCGLAFASLPDLEFDASMSKRDGILAMPGDNSIASANDALLCEVTYCPDCVTSSLSPTALTSFPLEFADV